MNQLHWQNNRNTNNYRLLFAHLDNRQLRHVEVSGDVRAHHRFKVLVCVFRERFWDINAGIVDEEINALEVPHSRISDPGSRLLLPMSPSRQDEFRRRLHGMFCEYYMLSRKNPAVFQKPLNSRGLRNFTEPSFHRL
jgi:hypothetical protein